MVAFRWGNQNLSLPNSANFLKTEMNDFLSTGDRSFVVKFKRAKESVQGSNLNEQEFMGEFKKIYEEVLQQPLKPLLENKDGWKQFSNIKSGKKGTITNQANIDFIDDQKIENLTDAKVLTRLKGAGALEFAKEGKVELPPFPFEEAFPKSEFTLGYGRDLEKFIDDDVRLRVNSQGDGWNLAYKKENARLDAHMQIIFPPIDEGKIMAEKADYILETTGQNATFKSKSSQLKVGTEIIEHSFDLTEKDLKKIGALFKGTQLTPMKLVDDKFEVDGERQPITTKIGGEGLESELAFLTALSDLERTQEMLDEDIVVLGEQYYYYKQPSGTLDNINLDLLDEAKEFVFANQELLLRILKPYLDEPTAVYTGKILANIKTKQKPKDTFRATALSTQTKDAKYSKTRYAENKENPEERITPEKYKALPIEERKKYKLVSKPLTDEEIMELTEQAFKHKETGETISELGYQALSNEDKKNYKTNLQVLETKEGVSGANIRGMETYGGQEYKYDSINSHNAEELFANAFVECQIYVINNGEYNLNPFRRGAGNRALSKEINKLKRNVRRLKKIFG
jgi:hypothetical protein